MTALDVRPEEPQLDLSPWKCPRCGYANGGVRGFCAGCGRQRPEAERPAPPAQARPAPAPKARRERQVRRTTTSGRRFGGYQLPIAVAALMLLVTGVVSAVVRSQAASSTSSTSSSKPAPAPASWDPRVADIAHFVERKRGLDFRHPVAVEFLDEAAFNRNVTNDQAPTAKQRSDMDRFVATLRALGLINGPLDLQQASNTLAQQEILGLYSPKSKRVYVRGAQMTPDVRNTLAHELTHALQDQHFDLTRYDDGPDGVSTGFRALFEADAVRVQSAYEDTMSDADKKALDQTRNAQVDQAKRADVPEVLDDILSFPYDFGPAFVTAIEHEGGNAAVDRAFSKPPASEAQILDPRLYLSGVEPLKVPAPPLAHGQTKVDRPDDFGQVSLVMVLGQRLDFAKVWPAVQGWAGDQYVTYRENGRVCVAIDTALKAPADADRFASVTREWAATMPSASSTRPSPTTVELRSCDPGNAGPSHAIPDPTPIKVLAVRSQIIAGAEQAGVALPVATCVADRILAEAGPAAVGGLAGVNDENDPRVARLQAVGARAASACARAAGAGRA